MTVSPPYYTPLHHTENLKRRSNASWVGPNALARWFLIDLRARVLTRNYRKQREPPTKKQTVCLLVKHFFEVTTKNIESLRPRILLTTNVSKFKRNLVVILLSWQKKNIFPRSSSLENLQHNPSMSNRKSDLDKPLWSSFPTNLPNDDDEISLA